MHDIFLSHSSANKDLARDLFKDIENVNGGNLTCWFDEVDIPHGGSITGLVNKGLEDSKYFAIMMTPEYFSSGSGWTDAEWHSALFTDPDNRSGRILPILAKDCPNLPPLLKHLKYFDIRGNNYTKGLSQLMDVLIGKIQRRAPKSSSNFSNNFSGTNIEQSEPNEINERLTSNLFPVLEIPKKIYFGKIKQSLLKNGKLPSKNELKEFLYQSQLEKDEKAQPYMPAFRTHKDNIVTFYNLNDSNTLLFNIIESGSVSSENSDDLIEDESKSILIVSLLNMSISRHIFKCGLVQDQKRQSRFYFPTDHGEANVIVWQSFKNKASRTVAKPVKVFDNYSLWLHQGAFIKLIKLGGKFFLQLIPTWVLTINGNTIAGGSDVAKIVNRWTNAERNLSIVRHLKFWSSILSKGESRISTYCGSSFIKIDTMAVEIDMQIGIIDDQITLLDEIELTSIDDIIEGKLSDSHETDFSELDDFSEEDEDVNYEEEDTE